MILLKSKDQSFGGNFYFKNMDDCEKFKYVFRDHWCNIDWEEPIEVDHVPKDQIPYMEKDPKKRAEDNLSWGFSQVRRNCGSDYLTDRQKSTVNTIVNTLSQ